MSDVAILKEKRRDGSSVRSWPWSWWRFGDGAHAESVPGSRKVPLGQPQAWLIRPVVAGGSRGVGDIACPPNSLLPSHDPP